MMFDAPLVFGDFRLEPTGTRLGRGDEAEHPNVPPASGRGHDGSACGRRCSVEIHQWQILGHRQVTKAAGGLGHHLHRVLPRLKTGRIGTVGGQVRSREGA